MKGILWYYSTTSSLLTFPHPVWSRWMLHNSAFFLFFWPFCYWFLHALSPCTMADAISRFCGPHRNVGMRRGCRGGTVGSVYRSKDAALCCRDHGCNIKTVDTRWRRGQCGPNPSTKVFIGRKVGKQSSPTSAASKEIACCSLVFSLLCNYALSALMTTSITWHFLQPDLLFPYQTYRCVTWTLSVEINTRSSSAVFIMQYAQMEHFTLLIKTPNFCTFSEPAMMLPFCFCFIDSSVCFNFFSTVLSNLCKDKRIEVILVLMSINSRLLWPQTLCMSFEALKHICMHETVKFSLLLL